MSAPSRPICTDGTSVSLLEHVCDRMVSSSSKVASLSDTRLFPPHTGNVRIVESSMKDMNYMTYISIAEGVIKTESNFNIHIVENTRNEARFD